VTVARARPIVHRALDEEDDEPTATVTQIHPVAGQPVEQGPIVVLADASTKGTPEHRYSTVCLEAYRHQAGVILLEGAYGGDNVFMGVRSSWGDLVRKGTIPAEVPMPRLMNAPTNGSKADRAQPVVALYEQTATGGERIYHAPRSIGGLAALEDEQTTWEPDSKWSPNRIDALVHGARYLMRVAGYQGAVGSATGLRSPVRARRGRRR
jgi:phage terminase large subunit-like protein